MFSIAMILVVDLLLGFVAVAISALVLTATIWGGSKVIDCAFARFAPVERIAIKALVLSLVIMSVVVLIRSHSAW